MAAMPVSDTSSPDSLRIFISHKKEDRHIAAKLTQEIKAQFDRINCFSFTEEADSGERYVDRIYKNLRESDWLILIYTGPTAEWDWCMFESGFYLATREYNNNSRLVCMHAPGLKPPKPLSDYHSAEASIDGLLPLLEKIYGDPPRMGVAPISRTLANDNQKLKEMAERIIADFGVKPIRQWSCNYVFIELSKAQIDAMVLNGDLPDTANIKVKSNSQSFKMFGLTDEETKWSILYDKLKENSQNEWTDNLIKCMRSSCLGEAYPPALPFYYSTNDKKTYRPVLHRVDKMPNDSRQFKLIFVETTPEDENIAASPIEYLFTLLAIARKTRWGILKPLVNDIRTTPDVNVKSKIDECLQSLAKIKIDAERGRLDLVKVLEPFNGHAEEDEIVELITNWKILKEGLSGIETKQDLLAHLNKMIDSNRRFMSIAANKYAELVSA